MLNINQWRHAALKIFWQDSIPKEIAAQLSALRVYLQVMYGVDTAIFL